MIHEGPLLEYAGRDLACLQWSAAPGTGSSSSWRRSCSCPTGTIPRCSSRCYRSCSSSSEGRSRLPRRLVAKMRILRAPTLLAGGFAAALVGVITWLVETGS